MKRVPVADTTRLAKEIKMDWTRTTTCVEKCHNCDYSGRWYLFDSEAVVHKWLCDDCYHREVYGGDILQGKIRGLEEAVRSVEATIKTVYAWIDGLKKELNES